MTGRSAIDAWRNGTADPGSGLGLHGRRFGPSERRGENGTTRELPKPWARLDCWESSLNGLQGASYQNARAGLLMPCFDAGRRLVWNEDMEAMFQWHDCGNENAGRSVRDDDDDDVVRAGADEMRLRLSSGEWHRLVTRPRYVGRGAVSERSWPRALITGIVLFRPNGAARIKGSRMRDRNRPVFSVGSVRLGRGWLAGGLGGRKWRLAVGCSVAAWQEK
ncbi:hypothetical protein HDK64DRAFT_250385 [Phyllosticta capitalensis]